MGVVMGAVQRHCLAGMHVGHSRLWQHSDEYTCMQACIVVAVCKRDFLKACKTTVLKAFHIMTALPSSSGTGNCLTTRTLLR